MKKVFIEKDAAGFLSFKEKSETGKEVFLPDLVWSAEMKHQLALLEHKSFMEKTLLLAETGALSEEAAKKIDAEMDKMEAAFEEKPQKVGFM